MKQQCSKCGEPCSGKLVIEARKGVYYPFCTICSDWARGKEMAEVRKIIKKNKRAIVL